LNTVLTEASGTSGFLRLAQEYQAAFGPSALNNKIRDLVPDLEYRPGDLTIAFCACPGPMYSAQTGTHCLSGVARMCSSAVMT
jgi:hypothetical protein